MKFVWRGFWRRFRGGLRSILPSAAQAFLPIHRQTAQSPSSDPLASPDFLANSQVVLPSLPELGAKALDDDVAADTTTSSEALFSTPSSQAPEEPPLPLYDVFAGADGWLFLVGGSNSALRYYTDSTYFTDDHAKRWVDLLARRYARLALQGVRYLHIAAPDKISVYPEMLGVAMPNFDRHPIRLVRKFLSSAGLSDLLVDPLAAFASHPARAELYLKTDSHWSYHAGATVFGIVTERLGDPRTHDYLDRAIQPYTRAFDLGSKLTPMVTEQYFAVPTASTITRVHANKATTIFEENALLGKPVVHGGVNVVYRSSARDITEKTVVIFGDSFMDFQPSNTTMIFAEHFRETHFVWSPSLDYTYIERVGADVVISESAERFMIVLPTDDYTLPD
jgi:alginate O-acetyltransferase complex protein AlgJ